MTTASPPPLRPGEARLLIFISSTMSSELEEARQEVVKILDSFPFVAVWAFEFTPGSSEPLEEGYLRKVGESDIFIWLVGSTVTRPVVNEVQEALRTDRRLWVIRLPVGARDEQTAGLLSEVGSRAKWIEAIQLGGLREALARTFEDEIVRALRGSSPVLTQAAHLELLREGSRARCIARWQAIGIPRSEAVALAGDSSVGAPSAMLSATPDKRVVLMVGDLGSGKSLIADRTIQAYIARSLHNPMCPLPVYIEGRLTADESLDVLVVRLAERLGDPRRQGAAVVVDGADEIGASKALRLLAEARALVDTWPKTTVVITSRPLSFFNGAYEPVEVPLLAETDACSLIGRISGFPVTIGLLHSWPRSVRDAIRRPLFALLMATHLASRDKGVPPSKAELISKLVERALFPSRTDIGSSIAKSLLKKAAALSIERGGPVPASDVGSSLDVQALLECGLVNYRAGTVSFSLPVLTEWFAAEALREKPEIVCEICKDPSRLERWRYPLVIAAGTSDYEQVSGLLSCVVEHDPAFASQCVCEAFAEWGGDDHFATASPREIGRRLRRSMESWIKGLGPLALHVAPTRDGKRAVPIGVSIAPPHIVRSWYEGSAVIEEVVDLPVGEAMGDKSQTEWLSFKFFRLPSQQGWPWRETLDDLSDGLSKLLNSRALMARAGSAVELETIWQAVLALTGASSLRREPISVRSVEVKLQHFRRRTTIIGIGGGQYDSEQIRAAIDQKRQTGETEFSPPWPAPDTHASGGWIWEDYSDEQLLRKLRAVYSAALTAYAELVEDWFAPFKLRLGMVSLLPATLKGLVEIGTRAGSESRPPVLHWYLQPTVGPSGVCINVGARDEVNASREEWRRLAVERFHSGRQNVPVWTTYSYHAQVVDLSIANPVTELAYQWLWNDLSRVSWVKGLLQRYR